MLISLLFFENRLSSKLVVAETRVELPSKLMSILSKYLFALSWLEAVTVISTSIAIEFLSQFWQWIFPNLFLTAKVASLLMSNDFVIFLVNSSFNA